VQDRPLHHYEEPELNLYALHDNRRNAVSCCSQAWSRTCAGNGSYRGTGCWPNGWASVGDRPRRHSHGGTAHPSDHNDGARERQELIADHTRRGVGEVQVPASVSNLLEFRMAQHGHEVVGFTVHVPHYLAQTDYPSAAESLLAEVAGAARFRSRWPR